jgi:hypothetical protein
MSHPLLPILDAGDRLADALDADDLDAARRALDDRQRAVDAAAPGPHEAPPALADRLRRQEERLARALRTGLDAARAEAGAAGRAAHAHDRYAAAGRPAAALLDTGRRG